jgi:hypothetical protein
MASITSFLRSQMFLINQSPESIKYYERMLSVIASLSKLFSESPQPYIAYRIAENLFCKSFGANNLSRSDCSADASKSKIGVGIKTFLDSNGATLQKVAEFNRDLSSFSGLDPEEKVRKIALFRNERILSTQRMFLLDDMIYHCVVRKPGKLQVFESAMDLVRLDNIRKVEPKGNSIFFEDGINEYSFSISKSTLYKRFITENTLIDFDVDIISDPFKELQKLLSESLPVISQAQRETVYLPLYSTQRPGVVPEKSGLNQWNAGGRQRDFDEVYIPIPAWVHKKYPGFFPPRDESFDLYLPDGRKLSAKICQENSKALMTNPNSALGQWLLRDMLNLQKGQIVTYSMLETVGIDSAMLSKRSPREFEINLTKLGSFDDFKQNVNPEQEEDIVDED